MGVFFLENFNMQFKLQNIVQGGQLGAHRVTNPILFQLLLQLSFALPVCKRNLLGQKVLLLKFCFTQQSAPLQPLSENFRLRAWRVNWYRYFY